MALLANSVQPKPLLTAPKPLAAPLATAKPLPAPLPGAKPLPEPVKGNLPVQTPVAPKPTAPRPPNIGALQSALGQVAPGSSAHTALTKQLAAAQAMPAAPGTAAPGNMQQIFTQRLNALMNQDPNALTANDPRVRDQIAAADMGLTRASEQRQAQLAEQMATEGLGDSGALQAGTERAMQDQGEASAVMRSQIMAQQLQAQRDQVMQALQLGGATLDAEKQRALAKQLASIDAAIRRQGLDVQSKLGQGQLNLGFFNALNQAQQYKQGLSQANQHFYDTLGWDMGKFQTMYNQDLYK